MKRRTWFLTAALLSAALASTAGCAAPASLAPEDVTPAPAAVVESSGNVLLRTAFDLSEVSLIVFVDTATLAAESDAVVRGTITRWSIGDEYTTNEGTRMPPSVLAEVTVAEVIQTNDVHGPRAGETIEIILFAPPDTRQELIDSLPTDLAVLAYLDARLSPAGQSRWLPHTQGFVVTAPDDAGEQIWPLLGSSQRGTLDDALPGGHLDGLSERERAIAQRQTSGRLR